MDQNKQSVQKGLFAMGDLNVAFQQYFTGKSYHNSLVKDNDVSVTVSNVSFEPGSRNNWHIHRNGYQILLVTGGEGWYQEAGKPAERLYPGDVVITHDGVKHWHGATKDSWFSHIAITAGQPEWLEPVSDTEYDALG
ncbi:cupin domain-containing protein [Lactiplantibacillus paraplantarum]|uniref:cupin domain-containing protein n=1 Tax=Lactiplantibacillus paraplantarum TaxID=60520 RepID=UPI0005136E51|nr:cupin domain-containing protein [Lactiplantibacillus paraplantarum]ALO03833.1 LytTR family transcriptional regulator [Lactiplantibacillus paraplantarum]KGE76034.1 LytTR family transcriptional regulator [Lactiplantibacillus paraplantarum]OAX74097.1 LytTR family transcriptional regulator [Lactiplantibacillus plantarum]RDG11269.1 cupin domain-containing protein [Lactiplantibacillus paraplantarum]